CPHLDEVVYRLVGVVADKWCNGTLGRSRGQIATKAISALMAVGGSQQQWDASVVQWLQDLKEQPALGAVSKLAATALAASDKNKGAGKKRSRQQQQQREDDDEVAVNGTKKSKLTTTATA
ncbi:hypothetical protein FOZ62_013164, partial [Perkinsus olseni]